MYNKIVIVGNLCHTPEVKYSKDGKKFCKLSIAVNDKYGERESTTFFSACLFDKAAEFVEKYARKGGKVLVEGKAAVSAYTSRDGEARANLEIKFANVKIIDWKEKEEAQTKENKEEYIPPADAYAPSEDSPF